MPLVITPLGMGAAKAGERLDVVELFTSQGCSSCPPADAVLGEMADRGDVLALSFNVDYWDYLGWKDTLASPDFTKRQKAYAHARGDRAVYTPQAVVNGMMHAVGSDRTDLRNAMQSTGDRLDTKAVDLALRRDGGAMVIETGKARGLLSRPKPATLWLVVFDDEKTVKIERGENRGKTVTYSNVVRRIEPIGKWTGDAATLTVPLPADGDAKCAVILQEGDGAAPGPILAAARL
ncbi:DUF1223 domain-containing protein [Microbaculum marinisediminis]|uniref:DUF1223 domain-containing protein n=1 Tax=Microbaculum marinisediminis TaxID=2931392 RepID=A0AAW5QZC7_9HYPH|nr:DUF1223 domain-containing protein [Microbaculum sp. A6E488]MCT8972297.1 DUF1223 domain-containing protein [Microbaculum sp. A6E488]